MSDKCVMCEIVDTMPRAMLVTDNDSFIAARDHRHRADKPHILVISRRHVTSIGELSQNEVKELADIIDGTRMAFAIKAGFRWYVNEGSRRHHEHLHVHVVSLCRSEVATRVLAPNEKWQRS